MPALIVKRLRGDESAPLGQPADMRSGAGTVAVQKLPQQFAYERGIVYLIA